MHDFRERLAFSEKVSDEDFWQKIYKKAFPDMLFAQICTGESQGQHLGIDRLIQLKSGKTIYIDEKKRESVYPDICLEYVSVDTTNAPGWMEKELLIDYLAYAFMPTQKVYLLPWALLKRSWLRFGNEWKKKYRNVTAINKGYRTLSVAVPIDVVLTTVKNSMIIQPEEAQK